MSLASAVENGESVLRMSGAEGWGAEWLMALLPMVLRRAEGTKVDGKGSVGAGKGDDLEEATQIRWGEVMHGLEG